MKESTIRILVIVICLGLFFAVFASYQFTASLENRDVTSTIRITDDRHSVSSEVTIYGVVPERPAKER